MRLNQLVAASALAVFAATAASAQSTARPTLVARMSLGSIQGSVSDEHGGPLAGAMVSAFGATSAMAITDAHGRFVLDSLPAGEYFLRVHLAGFASGRLDAVRVGGVPAVLDRIALHRLDGPLLSRAILTAGVAIPPETAGDPDHPHTETAWRLRHIKRSVLKEDGRVTDIADAAGSDSLTADTSLFGRAFGNTASFFSDTSFSGEVNLLTSSAFGPGEAFASDPLPRGIAYVSIGAPLLGGRWDVRASASQSDVSSWIVAGTFSSHIADSHQYSAGVSYSTQQYQNRGTGSIALTAPNDNTRAVGEIFASDRWTIAPALALEYGARLARYDYLDDRSLVSPHVGIDVTAATGTHVTASVAQRMLAPGAEEFLAPSIVGPWLPPERTFAPLAGQDFRVERGRFFDIGVNHEFDSRLTIGVRHFTQSVDDQLATLFGIPVDGGPNSPGHYYVASAGGVGADGWSVRVITVPNRRIRGTVDYSVARAQWIARGDMAAIAVWAPEAVRPQHEEVRDLTTSLETDIPETSTRVFLLYKINNAFARDGDPTHPSTDARFDVQVNQALPFMPLRSTRWEVLVGVRNLFRDPDGVQSIYDELLVVRPPKRVIGGVLVKF
jgi:hypothetical protein